jgi:hypothetical protein
MYKVGVDGAISDYSSRTAHKKRTICRGHSNEKRRVHQFLDAILCGSVRCDVGS